MNLFIFSKVLRFLVAAEKFWCTVLWWKYHPRCKGRLRATIFKSAGMVHVILLCYLQGDPPKMGHFIWSLKKHLILVYCVFYTVCSCFSWLSHINWEFDKFSSIIPADRTSTLKRCTYFKVKITFWTRKCSHLPIKTWILWNSQSGNFMRKVCNKDYKTVPIHQPKWGQLNAVKRL